MIGPALEYDDLRRLSRLGEHAQLATVERWANSIGLKYQYDGKGGIWTTVQALNAALGLGDGKSDSATPYHPDLVA